MKQYKITTADFITPGETGDLDAMFDADDLAALKKAAGISGIMQAAIMRGPAQGPSQLREVKHESTTKQVL
jgi:hypothetical protein